MWYCHRIQLGTLHVKKSEPTTTVSIRFPDTVLHAVRNISEAQDRSVSYLTVQAVRAWLAPVPTPQPVTAAQPPPPVAAVHPVAAPMPVPAPAQPIAKTAGEAKAMGLPRFFNGRACKRGHVAERHANGNCTACAREDNAARMTKAAAAV
jgi:hypothetical protein